MDDTIKKLSFNDTYNSSGLENAVQITSEHQTSSAPDQEKCSADAFDDRLADINERIHTMYDKSKIVPELQSNIARSPEIKSASQPVSSEKDFFYNVEIISEAPKCSSTPFKLRLLKANPLTPKILKKKNIFC